MSHVYTIDTALAHLAAAGLEANLLLSLFQTKDGMNYTDQ